MNLDHLSMSSISHGHGSSFNSMTRFSRISALVCIAAILFCSTASGQYIVAKSTSRECIAPIVYDTFYTYQLNACQPGGTNFFYLLRKDASDPNVIIQDAYFDTLCTDPTGQTTSFTSSSVCGRLPVYFYSSGTFTVSSTYTDVVGPVGQPEIVQQYYTNSACAGNPFRVLVRNPESCVDSTGEANGDARYKRTCDAATQVATTTQYPASECQGTPQQSSQTQLTGACQETALLNRRYYSTTSCRIATGSDASPYNQSAPLPTTLPTPAPPTPLPTDAPTPLPTSAPTPLPTAAPTPLPTAAPTPPPTAAPTPKPTVPPADQCVASICVQQTKSGMWVSNSKPVSQWAGVITLSKTIYDIRINVTAPAGASILSIWGLTLVSGTTYKVQDYRLDTGLLVPAGTTFNFGYQVSSASQASVNASHALCTPPPKNCTVTISQQRVTSYDSSTTANDQYSFTLKNIGNSSIASVVIRVTLATSAASITGPYNMNNIVSVGSASYNATLPLFNLAPGQTSSGSSGYTVTTPKTTGHVAAPAATAIAFNCLYSY